MKTNRVRILASVVACLAGTSLMAQDNGGGNFDPAQIQQRIARFQQNIAQMDPAQMQEFAAQFRPEVAQMDPAQFQQMAQQFQAAVAQVDPAAMQQMAQQFQQQFGQNFDPSQLQQQQTATLREQLGITDDVEWSIVDALVQKVMEAQRAVQADQSRGVTALNLGTNSIANLVSRFQQTRGNQNGGRAALTGVARTTPEADTVRQAIANNAPQDEMKADVLKLLEVRKAHKDALEKAQANLRSVLTVKQEAVATVNGLL